MKFTLLITSAIAMSLSFVITLIYFVYLWSSEEITLQKSILESSILFGQMFTPSLIVYIISVYLIFKKEYS
jgi:hypothetical protein